MKPLPIGQDDIDYESKVPLYRQIADALTERYLAGDIAPDELLPNEELLCRLLDVSRATARRAYDELVENNICVRRPGQGTFVKPKRLHRTVFTEDFHEEMRSLGREPASRPVFFEQVLPTRNEAGELHIDPDNPVWRVLRVDEADGEPLAVVTSVLPTRLIPKLTESDVKAGLFKTVEAAMGAQGESVGCVHEAYGAAALPAREATLLRTKKGAASFRIQRTVWDSSHCVWESSIAFVPGSTSRFDIYLHPRHT